MGPNRASPSRASVVAWVRLGLLAVGIAALGAMALLGGTDGVRAGLDATADSGWAGVATFVGLYALATVLMVPGSATTATAGVVYGTVAGAAVAVVGATIGAVIAYLIARRIGRRPVEVLVADRIGQLDSWLGERQFRSTVALRLLPLIPFNLFNYAAGVSPIRLWPYAFGTLLGIAPGALLVAAVGSSARQPTSPAFVVSVVALIVFVIGSTLAARRWSRR